MRRRFRHNYWPTGGFKTLPTAPGAQPVFVLTALDLATSYPEGFDALMHYFPISLTWFQDRTPALDPHGHWRYSLPGNSEIASFLLFSTGHESLLPAVQ